MKKYKPLLNEDDSVYKQIFLKDYPSDFYKIKIHDIKINHKYVISRVEAFKLLFPKYVFCRKSNKNRLDSKFSLKESFKKEYILI
jgi:hypothetical protein